MKDLIEKIGDSFTGGNFSRRRLERRKQSEEKITQAVRKIDNIVNIQEGKDILEARVKQLTSERIKQLQNIAAKANEDGSYKPGILTYNDFYQIALAVAELQPGKPPQYLDNAEMFTQQATYDKHHTPSSPITLEGDSPLGILVQRLRVGVDNVDIENKTGKLEFLIIPDQPQLEVYGKISESVWEKIHATGLPLRDTTWLHSIHGK
jgi:hypothetical protein